jgi:hypothetical protein
MTARANACSHASPLLRHLPGSSRPEQLLLACLNAIRAIEAIAQGLQWRRAQAPVTVLGDPSREDLQACWELGAAMAAGLT